MLKTVAAIKTVFGTQWEKFRGMMLMNNQEYSGRNPSCPNFGLEHSKKRIKLKLIKGEHKQCLQKS